MMQDLFALFVKGILVKLGRNNIHKKSNFTLKDLQFPIFSKFHDKYLMKVVHYVKINVLSKSEPNRPVEIENQKPKTEIVPVCG